MNAQAKLERQLEGLKATELKLETLNEYELVETMIKELQSYKGVLAGFNGALLQLEAKGRRYQRVEERINWIDSKRALLESIQAEINVRPRIDDELRLIVSKALHDLQPYQNQIIQRLQEHVQPKE